MNQQRRKHARIAVRVPATMTPLDVRGPGAPTLPGTLENVSLGGARVRISERIGIGSLWRIAFQGDSNRPSTLVILVRSCEQLPDGQFGVGGQQVADLDVLTSAGVTVEMLQGELDRLKGAGQVAPWNVKPNITARAPLQVASLFACTLAAVQDVTIASEVLDCTLDVLGRIIAPDAAVRGGSCYVMRGMTIGSLGDADARPTTIVLGRSLTTSMMLAGIDSHVHQRRAEIAERKTVLMVLKSKPAGSLDHSEREMLTEIPLELPELEKKCAATEAQAAKLRERELALRSIRLEVRTAIHPGVSISAGDSHVTIRERVEGPIALGLTPSGEFDILNAPGARPLSLKALAEVRRAA